MSFLNSTTLQIHPRLPGRLGALLWEALARMWSFHSITLHWGNMCVFYTYIWRRSDGTPLYVGKGQNKRAWNTNDRSREFKDEYAKGGCTVEIVDEFIHESQAHAHEMELISLYGRSDIGTGCLVNRTDGGDGMSGNVPSAETRAKISIAKAGSSHTAESRAKISSAMKKLGAGANNPMFGKKHTEQTRAKMSAKQRGERHPNFGKRLSEETRKKISEARRAC